MKIQTSMSLEQLPKVKTPNEKFREMGETDASRDAQLKKKSNELEAVFLTQLIQSMEKTIPDGSGSKNSLSTMMFGSVMGDAMTSGGGIGLSKMIFASLKKMDGELDLQEIGGNEYLKTMNVLQGINSMELDNE